MMDPLSRVHATTTHQQDGWHKSEPDQLANEDFYDPPGLVERVLQNVWKRLGLPAREALPRPLPEDDGRLPSLLPPDDGPDSPVAQSGGLVSFPSIE